VLLRIGYTAQAGAIGASLWESALATVAIICEPTAAKNSRDTVQGVLPWSAKDLAQIAAKQMQKRALIEKRSFSDSEFEAQWRALYGMYNWFCNLKHPTTRAVYHDAKNTQVSPHNYILMAVPDTRDEDLRMKHSIVVLASQPLCQALRCYGEWVDPDRQSKGSERYFELLDEAQNDIAELINNLPDGSIAVINNHTRLASEWRELQKEMEEDN
jgi:hypothetical protein